MGMHARSPVIPQLHSVGGFGISRFCACPEREVKIVQATQFDFSPELVSIGSRGKGSTILIRLGQQRRSQAAMPSSIQRLNSATLSFGQGSSQGMLPSSRVAYIYSAFSL